MKDKKYKIEKIDQLNLEIFGCNLKCQCVSGIENGRGVSFKKFEEDLFK